MGKDIPNRGKIICKGKGLGSSWLGWDYLAQVEDEERSLIFK